jgi:hypothetical protein
MRKSRHGGAAMKKKRTRAQGRKPDVVIPARRDLDDHVAAILMLGRRTFADLIAIGGHLAACREILKDERTWLAWLNEQFRWSRRTAARFIALYEARDKLGKLPTLGLPVSALYELAKAPAAVIEGVARRVEAGERPSLREIITTTRTPPEPSNPPRRVFNITTPPGEPTKPGTITSEEIHRAHAAGFPRRLKEFADYLNNQNLETVASVLPASTHNAVIEDARKVVSYLNALLRALWDARKPRLIDDADDQTTKH